MNEPRFAVIARSISFDDKERMHLVERDRTPDQVGRLAPEGMVAVIRPGTGRHRQSEIKPGDPSTRHREWRRMTGG